MTLLLSACVGCSSPTLLQRFQQRKKDLELRPLQPLPALQEIYEASVAVLNQKKAIMGSGVVVHRVAGHKIRVLTACHVVCDKAAAGQKLYILSSGDLEKLEVIVVKSSEAQDLALLETVVPSSRDGASVRLARQHPRLGEPITVIGCPDGEERFLSHGIISGLLKQDSGHYRYVTDAALYYGNSGGGVFNSRNELLGIAVELKLIISDFLGMPMMGGIQPNSGAAVTLLDLQLFLGPEYL